MIQSVTKVICISGKAQHGKDTTADIFKKVLEADGYKVLITHEADLLKFICKQYFGWNGLKDAPGRELLQRIGTDVIRRQRPTFWCDFIADILRFFPNEWDFVIVPDCRFPNEIGTFPARGFRTTHIRVVRDNFVSPLTYEQQQHPSEIALDNIQPDFLIHNSGSIADLHEKVTQWVLENVGNHQMGFDEIFETGGSTGAVQEYSPSAVLVPMYGHPIYKPVYETEEWG